MLKTTLKNTPHNFKDTLKKLNPTPKKITPAMLKTFLTAHRELLLQCLFAVAIVVIATYRITESTMPILLDDEYGYWSNAAFLTGTDWSTITQNIGYYSYGYSLLLVPVRLLARCFTLTWAEMYQSAQLINVAFLVLGYFLSVQICKKYMKNLGWIVRSAACFAVMVYGSNLFYAHISFTECTLIGVFWLFLYLMMKVTEKPTALNHAAYAAVSFYIFTVHQRALAVTVTSVLVVLYLRLVKKNTLKHAAAYAVTLYACSLPHAVLKGVIQEVCYRGNGPVSVAEALGYMFTKKSALLLVAGIVLFVLLYLLEKGKVRLVLAIIAAAAVIAAAYIATQGLNLGQGETTDKIAMNDFAGQWSKITGIFSKSGLVRLGTSIVGKWFYLAATTGLVICWAIRDLSVNFALMLADTAKRFWAAVARKKHTGITCVTKNWNGCIWFTGVFLAWFGTFMICAIYKEGFFKNDDLLNGRYHEFVIGIMLLYSLNVLIKEKNWFITALVSLALYLAAAKFVQFAIDELGRTTFELAHSVMFGRVIWNYQVPYGRIQVLSQYVLPLTAAFFAVFKLGSRFIHWNRIAAVRCVLALIIPVCAWVHVADLIVDNYVVVRNEKQSGAMPSVAAWSSILTNDEPIYYAENYLSYRQAEVIQFMLQDKAITMTHIEDMTFEENACYIIDNRYLTEDPSITEKCSVVLTAGSYALVVNKEQEIGKRWAAYEAQFQE